MSHLHQKLRCSLPRHLQLFDLTPLVDVVFLMLTFFILTADTLAVRSLLIENPTLEEESPPLTTQLPIFMSREGSIYLGMHKKMVLLSELEQELSKEILWLAQQHRNHTPTVVLSVDQEIEYGFFLQVFSIIQRQSPRIRLAYVPSLNEYKGL